MIDYIYITPVIQHSKSGDFAGEVNLSFIWELFLMFIHSNLSLALENLGNAYI